MTAPFKSTGFSVDKATSDLTNNFLSQRLGMGPNQCVVLYHSNQLTADNPLYINKIKRSLAGLKQVNIPHEISYPSVNNQQIAKNNHTAYALIFFKSPNPLTQKETDSIRQHITSPKHMRMQLGGEPFFIANINQQTEKDLLLGDMIAAPVAIVTLLIIFGSLVATLLPMGLSAGFATVILAILYAIAHATSLSIFTLNIALLLGLCLSLDYSLFMISRFREELSAKKTVVTAIEKTLGSAGKAVFFSGVAVFISLSALLFFPINILFSIGVGGLTAVFIAVSGALTLLPACLAVLGPRINRWAVRKLNPTPRVILSSGNIWYRIAHKVVNNPFKYFLSTLVFLFALAYAVFNIKVGISDFQVLPAHSVNQVFFDEFKQNFNSERLTPIIAVVKSKHGAILAKDNLSALYDWVHRVKNNSLVAEVSSIVSSGLNKQQYIQLYSAVDNPRVKELLASSTQTDFTVVSIVSKFPAESKQTLALIQQLTQLPINHNLSLALTGMPVINHDVVNAVLDTIPLAIGWVILLTYLVLLLLLRSLLLPLKAIFMNALSLCASYGVLVYIFQEGHWHTLLNFNPQGMLDINLVIIIFCALFGFSMDYEVFLLTRIQEAYVASQNNEQSIIYGIVKSSRIITSAALIVIVLCGSFMFADVLMVKEFGLGIAVAISVDAFAIRTLLVPATMALMKQWNWYLPKWMKKLAL